MRFVEKVPQMRDEVRERQGFLWLPRIATTTESLPIVVDAGNGQQKMDTQKFQVREFRWLEFAKWREKSVEKDEIKRPWYRKLFTIESDNLNYEFEWQLVEFTGRRPLTWKNIGRALRYTDPFLMVAAGLVCLIFFVIGVAHITS